MKTAQEMYQYCLDNGYGKAVSYAWGIRDFKLIENELKPDEKIQMCFSGLYNYVSILENDNTGAYALTDKRIIVAQQKPLRKEVKSIYYDTLNDVTLQSGIIMGAITIDTIRETIKIGVSKTSAQNIYSKIQEVLNSSQKKSCSSEQGQSSPADEIMKYKTLLDAGAITQEEFEQKKSQLLSL